MPTRYPTKSGVQWRAVVKIAGNVIATRLFPAGTEGKRQAAQWERDERKRLTAQQVTSTALPTVLNWMNRYSAYSEEQHTKQTFKEKLTVFKLFLSFTKITELERITPDIAMRYLQAQNKKRSGYSANKDRKNLAAAWEWGRRYIDGFPALANPFLAVPRFKEERKPRYIPSEADFWTVVDAASEQDKAMLLAFFYLGARRAEIFRLKWEDVDFSKNRVRLGTHKTADGTMRYDWLPLVVDLRDALADWYEIRPYKTEWVFTCLDDSPSPHHNPGEPFRARGHFMGTICERAGVKPFGFHAIRHLHASILFEEGSELRTVQRQLRHTNPNTTARYLHSLGYEAKHGEQVTSIMQGRKKKSAAIIPFMEIGNAQEKRGTAGVKVIPFAAVEKTKTPQGGNLEGSDTQSRYTTTGYN